MTQQRSREEEKRRAAVEASGLVKDGQTVVLGGLRKRETSKNVYKVPILGDLPFICQLFRTESETIKTNELQLRYLIY